MSELLQIYRERNGNQEFWGEPINALSNASFLLAAALALHLALQRQATTPMTLSLIALAATIGLGSFLFHTAVSPLTMWLDIIPIVLFQIVFLWLACREMLGWPLVASLSFVMAIVGTSFALLPIHRYMNGSLFYMPSLIAILVVGGLWSLHAVYEPGLLLVAGVCFTLAIMARSLDWVVTFSVGSHFVWHLMNGVVIYLALRSWIVHVATQVGRPPLQ
jgi:riboflavin transporter FmnP